MADATQQIDNGKSTNSINGTNLKFPSDLTSAKYYTKLSFVTYKRSNASTQTATEQSNGTVLLPIPINLKDHFEIGYTGAKLGLFGGAFEDYKDVSETAWAAGNTLKDTVVDAWNSGSVDKGITIIQSKILQKSAALKAAVGLMPRSWADTTLGQAFTSVVGTVPNPHLTAIFEGVALRTFSFAWKFSPRSAEEAQTLLNIRKFIKARAHPSYTANSGRFALDYPDQVYITFPGNDFIEEVKKCSIVSCDIDMGGSSPTFFSDGAPVVWTMSVTVQEVEIRTREDFDGTNKTATTTTGTTG